MNKSLSETLAVAKTNTTKLHEKTDTLNNKIREFTQLLITMRFGVTARVCIDGDHRAIEFGKHNGKWTILSIYMKGNEDLVDELTSASRSIRMLAVKHFRALVERIAEVAGEETQQVEQSINDVDRVMNELKGSQP